MVIAGKFDCGLDSRKGELHALGSCRFEHGRFAARWPGLGFVFLANYKPHHQERMALRIALRTFNAGGLKLHLGPLRLVVALFLLTTLGNAQTPLPNAHAHNDYEHKRPLLDALDHGFCSVEADIHLVNGKLLVAHDLEHVQPDRTLESLYLEPLKARIEGNKGSVYTSRSEFFLLIDIKTAADPTYAALSETLKRYGPILTEFHSGKTERKAVTVIISGNRPIATMSNETVRLAGVDGRLPDLKANPSTALFPWISDNWINNFKWRGEGPLSTEDKEKLATLVRQSHEQGRKLRLWGTPDTPAAWRELQLAGVDFINTDDLAGLQKFLTTPRRP
jgi:glycerophosphoryl diester phosphodiesterase